jgi:uncharacterized membrane protein YebE (DUF533 family)
MLRKLSIAALAVLVAGPVLAGTPVLNQREHNQVHRINQGVRSGELTRPEAARLYRSEYRLNRNEAIAKSDGVVTARERARLQYQADRTSARIYNQKHDAQARY